MKQRLEFSKGYCSGFKVAVVLYLTGSLPSMRTMMGSYYTL